MVDVRGLLSPERVPTTGRVRNPVGEFASNVGMCVKNRAIMRTKGGYIGLVPRLSSVGDCIVLAKGGKVPFVLKRQDERWRMVGECYVHGIMRGEAFEEVKCERI